MRKAQTPPLSFRPQSGSLRDFSAESAYMFAQVATSSPRAYFCVFIMPNLSTFLIKFTLKDTEYCSFPRLKHVDSRCDLVLVVFQRNPFPNLLKHGVSFSFTFRFVGQVVSTEYLLQVYPLIKGAVS